MSPRHHVAVGPAVAALIALAAGTVAVVAGPGSPGGAEPMLATTTVIGKLDHPWDIAFRPDGAMLLTERAGRIDLLVDGEVRVLAAPDDVVARGEGGMMGLAVDPDHARNRRIYTCFLSDALGELDVRIVRWQVDETDTALTGRTDILTGLPASSSGRHSGCRLRFGPDGYLWAGTGDSADNTTPQSPTSLGGKVLRITTDGQGAPGNAGAPFRPEVYSYGHRNVQGVAFDAEGRAYSIEHGTDRDDEVNLLVAGGNYGWDPVPPGGGDGYDESRPMTDLTKFPDARAAVWSSGDPTIAPSGGTFLAGARWGEWDGALALAVLKGRHLRMLDLDADGTAVDQEWARLGDHGRLRVAVLGPDGDLYVATDADAGEVLRVHPAGEPMVTVTTSMRHDRRRGQPEASATVRRTRSSSSSP